MKTRTKLPLTESYQMKIQLDRAVGWLIEKINESNLEDIAITPSELAQYEDIQNALIDRRSMQKIQ